MSTKTIKAGLSKANVNAIAGAIGTATLNRLVPQFSTSVSYTQGQYTNYNNQLYRFTSDKSAGAWDSSKVESASLNDLVDDVNGAVASVDNKANVDGNYPTLTAGLADNLTPYSEDSGTNQDEPFISQGTGTNNNTEIVTVGDYSLLKEKQGNSVVVNQLVYPVSAGTAGLTSSYDSTTHKWHITGTTTGYAGVHLNNISGENNLWNTISGHIYLVLLKVTYAIGTSEGQGVYVLAPETIAGQKRSSFICTANANSIADLQYIWNVSGLVVDCYIEANAIDLTQMFNGNIPQDLLDNPSNFSWYYNGDLSYNDGTLVNANGNKLVSTGRQLWDEEWEVGGIGAGNGLDYPEDTAIRSVGYIQVIPNATYYFNTVPVLGMRYYDKDKNFLGTSDKNGDGSITSGTTKTRVMPSDCFFIRFNAVNITTYNNNITISLYYTPEQGGEGYSEYYPYEAPYEVNTGSEVLRSAGSVKDIKLPSGEITRKVGSVDLGTLTYTKTSYASGDYFVAYIPTLKNVAYGDMPNIICSKYDVGNAYTIRDLHTKGITVVTSGNQILIVDDNYETAEALKSALSGVYLNFELATPTTEQGTAFAENLPIDDYGMLYWDNTNGVPQGANIFYQVNYKGFIDDMYSRVSGDSSQYVVKSDLTPYDNKDTQLQTAIGGTLRQCLCVKETLDFDDTDFVDLGELTDWETAGTSDPSIERFIVSFSPAKAPGVDTDKANILCSLYQTETSNLLYSSPKNGIAISASGKIIIIDTNVVTISALKSKLKGILLAYEKAE